MVDAPVEALAEAQPVEAVETVLWAGRYAILGTRKVPLIGDISFRTDNYLLAVVTRTETGGYSLDQRVCKITFEKTAGAKITMDESAPSLMPAANPVFEPTDEGKFDAVEWPSGWGTVDLDLDGYDGMAIGVQAPICGGTLHVASEAKSVASGTTDNGGLVGEIDIFVDQRIQEVQGACLRWMSSDKAEWMHGKFSYVPVPAETTCETLSTWPDPMPEDTEATEAAKAAG